MAAFVLVAVWLVMAHTGVLPLYVAEALAIVSLTASLGLAVMSYRLETTQKRRVWLLFFVFWLICLVAGFSFFSIT